MEIFTAGKGMFFTSEIFPLIVCALDINDAKRKKYIRIRTFISSKSMILMQQYNFRNKSLLYKFYKFTCNE